MVGHCGSFVGLHWVEPEERTVRRFVAPNGRCRAHRSSPGGRGQGKMPVIAGVWRGRQGLVALARPRFYLHHLGAVGSRRTVAPLGLDSEQRGWYVRAVALGSELPPVDLLETAIRSFFVDLDNERFEALATGLAKDAQLADEISGNWLLGEERVAGYLCAHQGMVTELVSELSGVRARWMAPAVGVVSFMLEQTYRFGDVRRHEKMTGSAIFVIETKELRLAMLHLGATSQSMSPVDYDRTVLPGEFTEDRPAAGETAEAVGPTMRRLRSQAKKSLRELARDAGVSPGFLSQLERGLADPSLATLQKISSALDVPITALFEQDVPAPSFVLRASQRRETTFPDSGVTYESLSPACDRVLDVWIGSIPPAEAQARALPGTTARSTSWS